MRNILVIAAHPDDAEFGAAGCIARWAERGDRIYYLICTNGDKGSSDPDMTPERLVPIREKEQEEAAATLGVKSVQFLGHPDGDLEYTREVRGQIVRAIRQYRPDLILTSDPYRKYAWHHDHRICGQLVLDAVYPYARDRLSYPEHLRDGLSPHVVKELYLWGSEQPDVFLDITDKFDLKIAALKKHKSQLGKRSDEELRQTIGVRAREAGQKVGATYGEQFHRVLITM
ncbi:MAG: PIG-L deacetylase family protein [Dehalococcoidia bacterium]|nr:PIG-L deacetylase family protein [Dehalococcoidia bacterium]